MELSQRKYASRTRARGRAENAHASCATQKGFSKSTATRFSSLLGLSGKGASIYDVRTEVRQEIPKTCRITVPRMRRRKNEPQNYVNVVCVGTEGSCGFAGTKTSHNYAPTLRRVQPEHILFDTFLTTRCPTRPRSSSARTPRRCLRFVFLQDDTSH